MPNIYEKIYTKLEKIGVFHVESHTHLESPGFMDLVIEKLGDNHYSLTHYFEQNGDLCPDPDMEIRVHPSSKTAEALSLQDCFGYRCVYPEPETINIRAKAELNDFLNFWLTNLINQGFTLNSSVQDEI